MFGHHLPIQRKASWIGGCYATWGRSSGQGLYMLHAVVEVVAMVVVDVFSGARSGLLHTFIPASMI